MAENFVSKVWSAVMAGYKAYQAGSMSSDQSNLVQFADPELRRLRYSILWAMYENTAYDRIHTWADKLKTDHGLYRYIRNIYNPSYRLGEFWKARLLGGELDPKAGDGIQVPSALPILTSTEAHRPAIAQIWQWSNWQIKKDVFGLWTPILGDGVLKIVDDVEREKVYIKVVNPGRLKDVDLDDFGNVKGYVIEYKREDPRRGKGGSYVTYKEVAARDGDDVVYQTWLDNSLYPWDGSDLAEWTVEYGFVPMVVMQHNDVGLDFGWSELFPGLSKFREVDDQASKLDDQIRKLVENPLMISGMVDPTTVKKTTGEEPKKSAPQPGREEMKTLWATNPDAKPHSLVGNIPIDQVTANIMSLTAELERDYPELKVDMANATGDISGRALRINRGPAEGKVLQRRPNYDNAMVRILQMAIAIAGDNKYQGFSGFNLESYADKKLDFSIGKRPVFPSDPMDKLEEDGVFWDNAKKAKDAGVPLPVFLKQSGWTDEKIKEVTESEEYKLRMDATKNAVEGGRLALAEGNKQPKPGDKKAIE